MCLKPQKQMPISHPRTWTGKEPDNQSVHLGSSHSNQHRHGISARNMAVCPDVKLWAIIKTKDTGADILKPQTAFGGSKL